MASPNQNFAYPPTPPLAHTIAKLAVAGKSAGFSIDEMVELLNAGLSVADMLDLIAWRLYGKTQ